MVNVWLSAAANQHLQLTQLGHAGLLYVCRFFITLYANDVQAIHGGQICISGRILIYSLQFLRQHVDFTVQTLQLCMKLQNTTAWCAYIPYEQPKLCCLPTTAIQAVVGQMLQSVMLNMHLD